ncbi:hypothetical protein FJY68_01115 [candidate division WOR-3 bacterium]|uniref:DUF4239 domain-containing protein n=1 Tax=candidate division WOR-3 bacterium TaxID=2052148 RepID=A0A938BSD2_UNCW3|nr:hypothetical protein [candidate division WOR-3 bacterium]
MTSDTGYWLCSAVAQSFAALTALTGLFAVYKLQTLRGNKEGILYRFLIELEKTRAELNRLAQGVARQWIDSVPDAVVPITGEHGWKQVVKSYRDEYEVRLGEVARGCGPSNEEQWVSNRREFFSELIRQHDNTTNQQNGCSKWAKAMTLADGIITLFSLVLILGVPYLGSTLPVSLVVLLVLAGFALGLTLFACVKILAIGELTDS